MTAEREGLAEIAGVLRWHALHASMNVCSCRSWRATPDVGSLADQHRAHLVDALADLLVARDRRVRGEAVRDVAAQWQVGEWTRITTPIKAGSIIGAAQIVTDWLRDRADRIEEGA